MRKGSWVYWCLLPACILAVFAGLAVRVAEKFAAYECVESRMFYAQLQGQYDVGAISLQEGDLLHVELQPHSGFVHVAVRDAQGRSVPVIAGRALIPATGRYTVCFRGKNVSFVASVNCYRDPGEG